jgi:hypothetical protein
MWAKVFVDLKFMNNLSSTILRTTWGFAYQPRRQELSDAGEPTGNELSLLLICSWCVGQGHTGF